MKITDTHRKIVAAGAAGTYLNANEAKKLAKAGHVEVNESLKDASGNVAVRATQSLTDEVAQASANGAVTESKPEFTLESNIPVPERQRGGIKGEIYPFSKMEVGQSFFIGKTEKHPEPAKTLASVVSSATRRYSVPDPSGATRVNKKGLTVPVLKATRQFTIRAVEGGARVWRTA